MMDAVAWASGILLAVCAIPQALKSIKDKHSTGVSSWMLVFWGGGEILLLIYTFHLQDWALMFNASINIIAISLIVWYKMFPTRS